VLAPLEVAWLIWFLVVPLPSAGDFAGPVRRGLLLLSSVPELIPGTTVRESLLGQAVEELSHFENLPQRLPVVAAALLIATAAMGLGQLMMAALRFPLKLALGERLALAYGLGTTGLGTVTLVLGRGGWLHPGLCRWGLAAIAVAGFAIAWIRSPDPHGNRPLENQEGPRPLNPSQGHRRPGWNPQNLMLTAGIVPFVVIMMLGAMLPAIDFDVLEYHLQGPKEYYQAGRISFLPHNVYTNMPFAVEMLHLIGMLVLDDWWWGGLVGQLLIAFFAPATAVVIAATLARGGLPRGGWIAAVVYLTTPWVYRLAVIAYVEGPLCFYHAALVWTALAAWDNRGLHRGAIGGFLGLLAGGAMACKYTALISAVIPFFAFVVADGVRTKTRTGVLAYLLGWSIVMMPWLAKNLIDTGNPVYPLGYRVFGGRDWDAAREAQWQRAHGPRPATWSSLASSLVDVGGRSDWQSPLYVALAPLAFLGFRPRGSALALAGYAIYLFLTWWLLTHRIDRFWLPLLPVLAMLAGHGADRFRSAGWRWFIGSLLAFGVIVNFVYCTTALAGLNEWTRDLEFLRRDVPRRLNPPLAAVDELLGPEAKILLVGPAAVYHLTHPILYNTVFNPETLEVLTRDRTLPEIRAAFNEHGVTHLYVDWKEIRRHRDPAGYGFTDYVTQELFDEWVRAGLLAAPLRIGPDQLLYERRDGPGQKRPPGETPAPPDR